MPEMMPAIGISIHALRVEGDIIRPVPGATCPEISIHALRVEGDPLPYRFGRRICEFLSTPSGWRATRGFWSIVGMGPISIHALRVEGDCKDVAVFERRRDFYPRPPGGGRQPDGHRAGPKHLISIHALRVEGDGWINFKF